MVQCNIISNDEVLAVLHLSWAVFSVSVISIKEAEWNKECLCDIPMHDFLPYTLNVSFSSSIWHGTHSVVSAVDIDNNS